MSFKATPPRPPGRLPSLARCGLWMGLGSLGTWCVFVFSNGGPIATPTHAPARVNPASATPTRHRPAPATTHAGSAPSLAADRSGPNPNVERLVSLLGSTQNRIRLILDAATWSASASEDDIIAALARLPDCKFETVICDELPSVMLAQLAHRDPELAATVAAAMLDDGKVNNRQCLEVAYAEWIDQDPAGAFSHALSHLPPDKDRASSILDTMLDGIGKTDPELADGFAADMARSGDPVVAGTATDFLSKRVSGVWQNRSSAQTALAWIDAQNPTPALREALGLRVLELAATGHQPELTSQLLPSFPHIKDVELRTSIIESLAKNHLPQVQAFILQNQNEKRRNRDIRDMLCSVAPSDRAASIDWLIQALPAEGRDSVLLSAAGIMESRSEWSLAIKAISEIQDAKTRTNLIFRYGFNWLGTDAAAARQVVPAEVLQAYDILTQITASGVLDVIPGLRPSLSYSQ